MEAIIHLFLQIIKITILAIVYSFVIIKSLEFLSKKKPQSRLSLYLKNNIIKRALRSLMGILVFIGLFAWMFSFWGNHGLGDSARIPVGNKIAVQNINWTEYGYLEKIQTSDNIKIETTKFRITNKKLVGNLDSWFYDFKNRYFLYDIRNNELVEFGSRLDFDKYAENNDLPTSSELLTFEQNYRKYWSGWRFWLLP